jgi:hypothetical protein
VEEKSGQLASKGKIVSFEAVSSRFHKMAQL